MSLYLEVFITCICYFSITVIKCHGQGVWVRCSRKLVSMMVEQRCMWGLGGRNRKLRTHILNSKQEAETE